MSIGDPFNDDDLEQPPEHVAFWAVLFEGGLAIVAIGLGWLVGHSPLSTVEFSVDALPELGVAALGGVAAAVPMIVGLVLFDRFPMGPLEPLKETVERLVVPLFEGASFVELAVISIVAGLGEEMLFRGLLQDGLATKIGGPAGVWTGLIVASIVFGLAHAITRTYVVLAAFVGVYLGLLFLVSGNLFAPIVAHALYDFVALVYLVKWSWRESQPDA